jgi:hypothetical protein
MTDMRTTHHGEKRVRKRIGIKKKAVNAMRDAAFNKGIKHSQATGRISRYFDRLFLEHATANNIRLYANYVWIFAGETLITVFPIPSNLRRSALSVQRKIK